MFFLWSNWPVSKTRLHVILHTSALDVSVILNKLVSMNLWIPSQEVGDKELSTGIGTYNYLIPFCFLCRKLYRGSGPLLLSNSLTRVAAWRSQDVV